ncbi:uncharacterized protein LOC122000905 [Zingiber officinale]|uniref:uncharacterized protein LOC122000905 n=1 Tax=Zingiber officinale TaxID=94328 RepID=UPI001C4B4CC9|nr:uncharacterized protein LOC122000905 [Zingiber officinale]
MPASEKIAYTLDKTPPKETPVNATLDELENLEKWLDHNLQARCYMLASMSKNCKGTMEKEKSVFLVGSSSGSKKRPKKKGKKHSAIMKKIKPNKKARPTKSNQSEHVYFHYNKPGHWRRNCKEYLAQKHFGKDDGKK